MRIARVAWSDTGPLLLPASAVAMVVVREVDCRMVVVVDDEAVVCGPGWAVVMASADPRVLAVEGEEVVELPREETLADALEFKYWAGAVVDVSVALIALEDVEMLERLVSVVVGCMLV